MYFTSLASLALQPVIKLYSRLEIWKLFNRKAKSSNLDAEDPKTLQRISLAVLVCKFWNRIPTPLFYFKSELACLKF